MVRILHISDPHGHTETMAKLNAIATAGNHLDVVAYTGDSFSYSHPQLPVEWSDWPQGLKLAVPGDHCNADTFINLTSWTSSPPWLRSFGGLRFIGVDTAAGCATLAQQILDLPRSGPDYSAVVLLSHQRPVRNHARETAAALCGLVGVRPLLLLHGHEHGGVVMEESEWEPDWTLGDLRCYRSKVISCARLNRGAASIISWDGSKFAWNDPSETVRSA